MARFANTGTYTIDGTEVLVADGTEGGDYCAFPGLVETAEGDLIVCYMRATDHATTRDGGIKAKRSTDGGATWGTEFTIIDDANDNRDPALVCLSTGRLICSFVTWDGSKNSPWLTISDDHGTTWGTPIAITNGITGSGSVTNPARVIELPNGDLLVGVYGLESGASLSSARVSRSTDEGDTWAALAVIRDGDTWGRQAGEPCLAYDPVLDRVWCSMRSDVGDGVDDRIYLFHSDDVGATWTTPSSASIFDASGKPAIYRTREGALLIAYRDSADNDEVKYRISTDDGATFGAAQTVNSTRKYEYVAWWQRDDPAKLCMAWAVEFTANTDSRVYFQDFEEHHPLYSVDKRYPLVLGAP